MSTRSRGNAGEDMAVRYIERAGGTVLARNHYVRGGEVDIIFRQDGAIVFCEVKLRSTDRLGGDCGQTAAHMPGGAGLCI